MPKRSRSSSFVAVTSSFFLLSELCVLNRAPLRASAETSTKLEKLK